MVLNGDGKASGTVARLAEESVAAAKREALHHSYTLEATVVHLGKVTKSLHRGQFNFPRWLRPIFKLLQKADIVIFATPVHSYTMSALMKNMLDYLYSLENKNGTHVLDGKVAGVIVHGREDGATKTAHDLSGTLNDCGLHRPPHSIGIQIKCGKDFSENGWQLTEHLLAGENVVRAHLRLSGVLADTNRWDLRHIPAALKKKLKKNRSK